MGFYLRKSIRVGPLRFNLSKSGIGVSAGIPGFRVGMGPRGNYVHAGRDGFYYRATLPSGRAGHATRIQPQRSSIPIPNAPPQRVTLGPEEEIESGSVLAMQDESAAHLLAELNSKKRRLRFGPGVLFVAAVAVYLAVTRLTAPAQVAVALAALGATFAAFMADAMRKTTVIMYDLDQDASASYQGLVDAATALGGGERLWHIPSRAVVLDRKYHAGAQSEVRRASTTISVGSMPFVKCNLDVPSLQVGRQTLYFMPDRMLIFDAGSVGGLGYSSLRVQQQHVTCVEPEDVPSDSRVVGRTWRFVNKSGGPDRRFRDNRELPICEYDAISFTSDAGLNELLHSSRLGVADKLIRYLSDGAALAGGADRGSGPKSLFS